MCPKIWLGWAFQTSSHSNRPLHDPGANSLSPLLTLYEVVCMKSKLKWNDQWWLTNWTQSILNSIFRFPKIQSSERSNQRLWSLCAFSITADLNMGITLANDDAGCWKLRQMHRFLPGVGWITEPIHKVGNWRSTGTILVLIAKPCKTDRRLLPFVHTYLFAEPTQNTSVGQQCSKLWFLQNGKKHEKTRYLNP